MLRDRRTISAVRVVCEASRMLLRRPHYRFQISLLDAGILACSTRKVRGTTLLIVTLPMCAVPSMQSLREHLGAIDIFERNHHVPAAAVDAHLSEELQSRTGRQVGL